MFHLHCIGSFPIKIGTQIEYGPGTALRIMEVVPSAKRFLTLIDKAILEVQAVKDFISLLEVEVGCNANEVVVVSSEPTVEIIEKAAALARDLDADVVVGLGGGSTMDTAKATRFMFGRTGSLLSYANTTVDASQNVRKLPALVTIPSTAGTGAEISTSAVITNGKDRSKFFVAEGEVASDYALVDPLLCMSLPSLPTAYCGLDALAQAIGACLSTLSNPASEAFGMQAIRAIWKALPVAATGQDYSAKTEMVYGSLLSAVAMSLSECMGEHILAEVVGSYYGIPHGIAVSIFLPYIIKFNEPAVGDKVKKIEDMLQIRSLAESVETLARSLRLPTLLDLCLGEPRLDDLTMRCMNHPGIAGEINPRRLTMGTVKSILSSAFRGESLRGQPI